MTANVLRTWPRNSLLMDLPLLPACPDLEAHALGGRNINWKISVTFLKDLKGSGFHFREYPTCLVNGLLHCILNYGRSCVREAFALAVFFSN